MRAARAALATAALALLAVAGCSPQSEDRPHVVVTTNILGDVTRNVLGDEADVTVLMKPNADPHSFGVSARRAAEIENADLVVFNGLGLEENVLRHVEAAREAGVVTLGVGEKVDPIDYTSDASEGQPDPHFWTDPDRMGTAVDLLAESVVKNVDGIDGSQVRQNARAYRKDVAGLSSWMEGKFGRIPSERKRLVTNHHVFGYLAQRFGFTVVGAVIPSGTTLASPSAADLDSLATAVEKAGVSAIFADSSQPDRLAQVLKKESDVDVDVVPLFSESLTGRGGGAPTYLQMMRANTRALTDGLTG
ncbi:zinc ABC transporter substrate-binding protein AztC [Streptomyces sp. DSM 42041]|uniref:Zinc ABC transporter substrate-binding protein AztC n=1 Tax=Streptomyces hazeniae TaxID=3075538 RepID=A0ABU2NQI6_9ACTN|nr:zinc ABC transporter substrate-binding protein AztC [Streptomyces sp. DSM 42041]MDT0379243.1 zinc ABC transporter substrate-binding protein AztC [Streptomyces sp. DSM 42041]